MAATIDSKRAITTTFYISFLILGLTVPLLGVTVNDLTARFGMPVSDGGIFPAMMGFGTILASAVAGRLYDRLNARTILPVGTGVIALSIFVTFIAVDQIGGLLGAFLLGLGFGIFMIGPNILIARLNPDNAAGPLNALNFTFGVGAIIAPQLVTLGIVLNNQSRLAYVFAGAAMLLVTIPLAFVNIPPPEQQHPAEGKTRLNYVAMIPFLILFFCSMSSEVSFNVWIVTQLEKAADAPLTLANFGASMFWFGYTLSRAGGAWLGRRIAATRLLIGSIITVILGITLMLLVPASSQIAIASAFIVGAGIGPLFPTNMALASAAFPQSFGQVTGFLSAIANIGPMTMPWLQGRIGAGQDGGMELILILALILLAVALYIARQKPGALAAAK